MNKVKYLLTYRYAEIIHDLTFEFVKTYIDYRSRTRDQMEQAARSGKQNIVEGVGQSQTSKSGEIKLLGVAKASFEELLADFEDYLRQNNLKIYDKNDPRITSLRQIAYRLSSQETYLLDRQIKAAMEKFAKEGGVREKLFTARKKYRGF